MEERYTLNKDHLWDRSKEAPIPYALHLVYEVFVGFFLFVCFLLCNIFIYYFLESDKTFFKKKSSEFPSGSGVQALALSVL